MLSTSTFIGWQLGGFWGAVAATVGIFLPSFLFVWLLNPLVSKMRQSILLGYFLDSVNVAAVAIMIAVLIKMGQEVLIDWRTILITILSFYFIFFLKEINALVLVAGGALLGFLLMQIETQQF